MELDSALRRELQVYARKSRCTQASVIRAAIREYMTSEGSRAREFVVNLKPELATELEAAGKLVHLAPLDAVVKEAVRTFIRSQSRRESKEFLVELPEDLALDFRAFREARDWSDRDYVVERAIRMYIRAELDADTYISARFDAIKAELTDQLPLPFVKSSTGGTVSGPSDE